ncbi:MAG: phage tail protein [Firmicutes bacterium]|nr:phage tail protein [Bacillota bacterium]
MYQFDDVGSTLFSFPPNLQTRESDCFGYAFDRQIGKLHQLAKQITVWSALDQVDPKYYDFLAMTIQAPYYKSEYSNDQKLGLIKSALLTRRYAGTIKAIEELLSHTLTDSIFVPWYEYGGKPFCFKVMADGDDDIDNKNTREFVRMISTVKSARSHLDSIEIKSIVDNSGLNNMRVVKALFFARMPFYPLILYDGTARYDGAERYDAKRRYKLGVGLKLHSGIAASKETVGNLVVETRRNVKYYNGEIRYDGTTKYDAMDRRDEIE